MIGILLSLNSLHTYCKSIIAHPGNSLCTPEISSNFSMISMTSMMTIQKDEENLPVRKL